MQHPRPPPWASLSGRSTSSSTTRSAPSPTLADYQLAARARQRGGTREASTAHSTSPLTATTRCAASTSIPAPRGGCRAGARLLPRGLLARAGQGELCLRRAAARARGVTTVIANYELCPGSTLDGVLRTRLAPDRMDLPQHHRIWGRSDPHQPSGHSAGAHLCAEILAADWRTRGHRPGVFRGAVLIAGSSTRHRGIRTTVNAQLNLTPEMAARHDVELRPPLSSAQPGSSLAGESPGIG